MYIRYTTSSLTIVEIIYKHGKFRMKKKKKNTGILFTRKIYKENRIYIHYIPINVPVECRSVKYYLYTFNKRLK